MSWATLGYSLLEMMLVLAVFGSLLAYGLAAYSSMQKIVAANALAGNVDMLLRRLALYYRANCKNLANNFTVSNNVPSASSVPVPLNALLGSSGVLANTLVDTSDANNPSGFIAQLNPIVITINSSANACVVVSPGTRCQLVTSVMPTTTGTVVYWVPQVAVKIIDTLHIATDQVLTGADCVSILATGGTTVTPCASSSPTSPRYLVWSRTPATAVLSNMSVFSSSMPVVQQFNLQYTQDSYYQYSSVKPSFYYTCNG